ncbi:unnamed protein product, partial [Ectocarpus sp. 4 AP-2014]
LLSAALVAVAGCSDGTTEKSESSGKPHIVATTGMVADLVRQVAGEAVEVEQIMGAGVDPHLYKPTRDDVQAILSADAVFYSGLMLEGKMGDTLVKVGRSRPVFAVTELIDESKLLEDEGSAGHPDPHVWMDVAAWSECVGAVATAMAEVLPAKAAEFEKSAERHREELLALDAYAREAIATVPEARRVLVTSHDAFNYFGRAYGIEVLGVQGISTESEAGLRRINELVALLVERQVPAVFVESSVSPKNIQALVDGAAANGHEVVIGGELFSDAMGQAGTYEGTYLGMLDHNATTVARALGGVVPPLGKN